MRLGTIETLAFVRRWFPNASKLLEVGSGEGELALALQDRGYEVVALEPDGNSASAASAAGVRNVIGASWPEFDGAGFDAIIFSRSLHHIEPLEEAVRAARHALVPRGGIIIEDFAVSEMSPQKVAWLREQLAPFAIEWEAHADIHPFTSIRTAVARYFEIVNEEDAAYCYRYVPEEHASRLFNEEAGLGERLLGRRLVGFSLTGE